MTDIRYRDHTDTVADKVRLLEEAYAAANFDLAMSLVESIKDTLSFERQTETPPDEPNVVAETVLSVDELPRPWAEWARGWKFCHVVDLFESVGIARTSEPVELTAGCRGNQMDDPHREVRVARVDDRNGSLHEVASQVDETVRRGDQRRFRLVFLADVAAHQRATYLVFFGNENAELPCYASNLQVAGQGYRLDISNEHYRATLSRQTGQLDRLTYARQHGLELYAGGKGHGEPPDIDWGHDYVDQGHFQKLRIRNWAECPNYRIEQGPLCVRVRRWGFPHSPVHPVFTPSRIHMDVSYSFFAGLPYFFKQSRFDVVKDCRIEAMRDDEWVFSGYSFTDQVWIDEAGKLHEGSVPGEQAEKLWGVGFYHRTSRDAFIALRLEHAAEGWNGLRHGGVPTLHYDGHGQLWSRYPAHAATLKKGTSIRQKNAYLVSPYPKENAGGEIEQLRHRLMNPLIVQTGELPRPGGFTASGQLARPGETAETALLKPAIWKTLREVKDEQFYTIDANIVDMGYVYDVRQHSGVVQVLLTMPHRGRPVYQFLVTQGGGRVEDGIRERLLKLEGVRDVVVDFTWNPAWTRDRLTDAARRSLGLKTSR